MSTKPLVVAIAFLHAISRITVADDPRFDAKSELQIAVEMIGKHHAVKQPFDDNLSRKWLRSFVDRLDPKRLYFLRNDLHEFRRFEDRLDDHAKQGDLQFPELVRKRLRERTKTAVTNAVGILATKPDFTVNEECPLRFEDYAANEKELLKRWRVYLKAQLLIEKLHGRSLDEVQTQLAGRYRRIAKQAREMSDERLCGIYLNALLIVYGPRSEYFTPTMLELYNVRWVRTYGIGMGFQRRRGEFVITRTILEAPKLDENELIGWSVLACRRSNGQLIDVVEMPEEEFHRLIRMGDGPLKSDKQLSLELIHPRTTKRRTVTLNRRPTHLSRD